jgi:predicted PurR-regulated permease PerM
MAKNQIKSRWVWMAVLIIMIALVFFVSGILMPFVAGMAVAYFLDPLADKLESIGLSRTIAAVCIIFSFFIAVVLILVLIFPLLKSQFIGFIDKIPLLFLNFSNWVGPFKEAFLAGFPSDKLGELSNASESYGTHVVQWFGNIIQSIFQGSLVIFNTLSLILVTPIVSFYLLRDWDIIVMKVDGWLPREFAPIIRKIVADIDRTIAGFVRGQGTVCLLLAIFYGLGLTLIGLDFGLILGITTGLISFVPYFGMLIGMISTLVIAISQYGDILPVVLVLIVFGIGQLIESMFLTPKLVGEKVGLHAVWVIFSLMAGGATFGFTGLLLAVPVAATIGVLVRFLLTLYLKSGLYLGSSNSDG